MEYISHKDSAIKIKTSTTEVTILLYEFQKDIYELDGLINASI